MKKIDPIIAVKDLEESVSWYQTIFGCRRAHGGNEFAVMVSENDEVLICLHKWGAHEHPSMAEAKISPGNGLILYYKTVNINDIKQHVEKLGYPFAEAIHLNTNSNKMEFSLRDPDGYYLTITEYHNYEG